MCLSSFNNVLEAPLSVQANVCLKGGRMIIDDIESSYKIVRDI